MNDKLKKALAYLALPLLAAFLIGAGAIQYNWFTTQPASISTAAGALTALGGASLAGNNNFTGTNTFNVLSGGSSNLTAYGVPAFPAVVVAQNVNPLPFIAFNTWYDINITNAFTTGTNIMAQLVADGMVSAWAGSFVYEIDDEWMQTNSRTPGQPLAVYSPAWPTGMQPFVQYGHTNGFQMSIYTAQGTNTCEGHAASAGYEELDIDEFANWGLDWVKVDGCGISPVSTSWPVVAGFYESAIIGSGQKMGLLMSGSGNSAYTIYQGSLVNCCEEGAGPGFCWLNNTTNFTQVLTAFDTLLATSNNVVQYPSQVGPGHFTDNIWMEVGGVSYLECGTNLVRQGMTAAALLASAVTIDGAPDNGTSGNNNLLYMTNSSIRQILQDPLVARCSVVSSNAGLEVLSKPLVNQGAAVGFINRSQAANSTITVTWPQLGFPYGTVMAVFDPWAQKQLGFATNSYSVTVAATNDITLVQFVPQPVGTASLAANNHFTGSSNSFPSTLWLVPTNFYTQTNGITRNAYSSTITSTNGAFYNWTVGYQLVTPGGQQYVHAVVSSNQILVGPLVPTALSNYTTPYQVFPPALIGTDINGVPQMYVGDDGTVGNVSGDQTPNFWNGGPQGNGGGGGFIVENGQYSFQLRGGNPGGIYGEGIDFVSLYNAYDPFFISSQAPYQSVNIMPSGDLNLRYPIQTTWNSNLVIVNPLQISALVTTGTNWGTITATGWTNATGTNCFVLYNGTAVTVSYFDAAGSIYFTNSFTGNGCYAPVQAGGKITAPSGLTGVWHVQ
jgi:hypothetical protein